MLELKQRPQNTFAGIVVSLKDKDGVTYLTFKIPYQELTKQILGDVFIAKGNIPFSIHLGNEKTYLYELEEIITNMTNVPLEYVFFSKWFVNDYVNKKEWEKKDIRFCYPTEEEVKESKRQKWLYSSWLYAKRKQE